METLDLSTREEVFDAAISDIISELDSIVNHENEVVDLISTFADNRDMGTLLELARYYLVLPAS